MLSVFFRKTKGRTKQKYETKLNGIDVYNACYATSLSYSQRRFKQLKQSQQVYGKVATVHRNMCHLRKGARMSVAHASFEEFVKEVRCMQPHKQIWRKANNSIDPLILLPINTTKVDVFHYVNEENGGWTDVDRYFILLVVA